MGVAGVDLGGTNCSAGLVEADGSVTDRAKVATPTDGPSAVVEAIAAVVAALEGDVEAVGIGAPGAIHDGVVLTAPNLAGWDEPVRLAERAAAAVGVPVVVDNDATVGAVGEWAGGAARGSDFVLGVWLGTGVGGGLVLDGRPYRGAHGAAGELGHMCVVVGGATCGCGRRGCIEAYAGRASMERVVAEAVADGRDTLLTELAAQKKSGRMTSGVWAKALDADDEVATEVLDTAVAALGAGIGSVVNLLDVDRVVVGGGLAEKLGTDLCTAIAAACAPHLLVAGTLDVRLSELGDDAGIVGAAALARDALGRAPGT